MVNLGGQSHHAVSTTLHTLLHSDWKAISLHSTMLQGWSAMCGKSETASQRINKLWIPSEACKPFFTSSSYPSYCFFIFLLFVLTSFFLPALLLSQSHLFFLFLSLLLSVVISPNHLASFPPLWISTPTCTHISSAIYFYECLHFLKAVEWGGRPQHETKMWVSLTGAGWSREAAGDKPRHSISGSVTITCWKVICKSALENRTPFVSLQLSLSLSLSSSFLRLN